MQNVYDVAESWKAPRTGMRSNISSPINLGVSSLNADGRHDNTDEKRLPNLKNKRM